MWPRLRSLLGLGLVAVVASGAAACGGGKATGSFDGNVYRKGPIAFQLPDPPAGWKRIAVDDASLAFRDEAHAASVLLNARCLSADDRTPLVALTNHLLIGATEREYLSQETVPFDSREALHTKLKAKWDGVPMFIDVFVLSKDGCIYDFIYLGSQAGSEGGAPTFESFVRGFRTLRGSGVVG
ncbi:MAG: hypothetical protein BGO98_25090 [Myxococcales bacterium 68-20]|nr:hypothetical protein [Myxococcales bacterium]OJY15932.1 MAG: hypothetical protein BGO98_25090 [Myxococcales bacterium 68-20]